MKIVFTLFISIIYLSSCAQKKHPVQGGTEFQRKINAEYKDVTTSPLKDKERKNFKGLDFFKFDVKVICILLFSVL